MSMTHPLYQKAQEDWQMLRHSYEGERVVKEHSTKYLPPTPGMVLDGMSHGKPGLSAYNVYISRAVYPDFFEVGISTLIGILNAKETVIELPAELEYLREKAMLNGQGLNAVIRAIHEEQLVTGRVGLMAELPEFPDPTNPQQYLNLYPAEAILNWDNGAFNDGFDKLNMVLLDESGFERQDDFSWKEVKKYRVLSLGDIGENTPIGVYKQGVSQGTDFGELITPVLRNQSLDEIPFVFVGSKDICVDPDKPPTIGLARLCMTIYRGEADYRQTLFMQGQDTLVVVGGLRTNALVPSEGTELRVGAGARIDVELNGDAKYVGVSSTGLPEQRSALEADRTLASVKTGQLLAPGKMSMESGEALKTRIAAQTATLTSVALAAAAGLESILRTMAKWQGGDPKLVRVIPNLDFTNVAIAGQDIVQLVTAKNLGYPMSYETLFSIGAERGLFKGTFEEEVARIEKDPQILVDRAIMLSSPQGNNPIEGAGGPKKTPEKAPVKSNKPTK